MKIISSMVLIILANIHLCNAQHKIPVPLQSNIGEDDGIEMVESYQDNHVMGENFPTSFLINVNDGSDKGLRTYLKNTNPTNAYLHVFFALDKAPFMAIVGLGVLSGHMFHDPYISSVWCSSLDQPGNCVEEDFDGEYSFDKDFTSGCDISDCTPNIMTKATAKPFVSKYQATYKKNGPTSFLINANGIRDLLVDNNVKYLQIYLAEPPGINDIDSVRLVIVGVKENLYDESYNLYNGLHVVSASSNLYDESVPCPECLLDKDPDFPIAHTLKSLKNRNDHAILANLKLKLHKKTPKKKIAKSH